MTHRLFRSPGSRSDDRTISRSADGAWGNIYAEGLSADEAAILDTLTRSNNAEREAAALLTIELLRRYMDANGPFAQRRSAQLAERQRRNAHHRGILVRPAIGQVSVAGTTATCGSSCCSSWPPPWPCGRVSRCGPPPTPGGCRRV